MLVAGQCVLLVDDVVDGIEISGDELGRTQHGNNNAYCQDNEISWLNWDNADAHLLSFTQKLIRLRREHPVFRRCAWFHGHPTSVGEIEDIAWFKYDGQHMEEHDWHRDYAKSFAVFINGRGMHTRSSLGARVIDDSFYIIFNSYHGFIHYKLPAEIYAKDWTKILDTSIDKVIVDDADEGKRYKAGEMITVRGNSILLLHHPMNKTQSRDFPFSFDSL